VAWGGWRGLEKKGTGKWKPFIFLPAHFSTSRSLSFTPRRVSTSRAGGLSRADAERLKLANAARPDTAGSFSFP
jgi:hypothetical protein